MATVSVREQPAQSQVPQFQLRTLFVAISWLAVLFAVIGALGPIASGVLLFLMSLIGLHVAGNVVGTSLRNRTSQEIEEHRGSTADAVTPELPPWAVLTPRLSERTPLRRWVVSATICLGAAVGGAVGALIFSQLASASTSGLAVGVFSLAVLGAFFGFLIGSFFEMFWRLAASFSRSAAIRIARYCFAVIRTRIRPLLANFGVLN